MNDDDDDDNNNDDENNEPISSLDLVVLILEAKVVSIVMKPSFISSYARL